MSPKNARKVPGSPDEWMDHAESDMRLACLAAGDRFIRREHICFHAQQAVEKAIKAVLSAGTIEFPLTHDIEELLEITGSNDINLPESVREAGLLTPYAVETRYPGYWMDVTENDVQDALRIAKKVIEWAKRVIDETKGGSR